LAELSAIGFLCSALISKKSLKKVTPSKEFAGHPGK
jgi:hypothetical protein